MNNRLQFRHHNEVFDTREDAIDYIKSQIRFAEGGLAFDDKTFGYSLFAEPTVLLYKKDEGELQPGVLPDPHLMLVIGSQTNLEEPVQYSNNRFCIIDIDKTEQEIADLQEELEKAIRSLTLIPLSSDTLNFYSNKTEEGTYVSGDVKVAETHIFDDVRYKNNLLVTPEGLFIYVNLEYDKENEEFTFTVSNSDDTLSSVTVDISDNYLVNGRYSVQDESLHLFMKKGEEIVIDCKYLIAEWGVIGDAAKSPVILTKEEVKYGTEEYSRLEPWQDVLKANVRIKDEEFDPQTGKPLPLDKEKSTNILQRTQDGRYLFVDGVASNIVYWQNGERTNVKEVLDELSNIKLSTDNDNILTEKTDGFFASSKLEYVSKDNKLIFKTSGQNGEKKTEIQLNSVELFEHIYYDPTKEALIVTYKDNKGETQFVEIPIGEMIRDWEWEPQNEGHNVKIVKIRKVSGNDKVSADARIYPDPDNILVDKNHELFVKGTSDNIRHGEDSNVKKEIDTLHEIDAALDNKINIETARAKQAEQTLDDKIDQEIADRTSEIQRLDDTLGSGFTTDIHETVTYKLNEEIEDRIADVNAEEARAKEEELRIDTTIGSGFSTDAHETVTYKFNQLQDQVNSEAQKLQNEINRSIAKDIEHDGRLDAIDAEIGEGFGPRNTVRDEIDREKAEREAAARRAAAQKAAAQKNAGKTSGAASGKTSSSASKSSCWLTPEERQLSGNFEANRGRLPVPLTGPYRIAAHFGQYRVEGLSHVTLDNKGVNYSGQAGARARSVFDGVVTAVFAFGGTKNVLIRHGSYISVYCNLSSVIVSKGQKVKTRDLIGTPANDDNGHPLLHFQLRKETAKLNPEVWIGR